MRRYALRDDQWDRIKDFLPGREGHVGGTAADNRHLSKRFVSVSSGYSMARPARSVWQLEDWLSALQSVGEDRRF